MANRPVFLGKQRIGGFFPGLGPPQTHFVAAQDFAKPTDADVGHDLLLDQILTQFRHGPLRHADERDRRRQGDFGDVLANLGGEHAGGTHLKPGIPGDPVDARIVETMKDLPHPLHGAADHFGDDAIGAATDGEQDHAGIAAVHGIAPLPHQAAEFDLFVWAKPAYSNYVFHGDTSRENPQHTPLEVSYSNPSVAAARKSSYFNGLRRETCQLKTALVINYRKPALSELPSTISSDGDGGDFQIK